MRTLDPALQGGLLDSPAPSAGRPNPLGGLLGNMNRLQQASLATTPLPVVPDVLGLLGDAQMYAQQPESRTALNYGLSAAGLLPGIPAVGAVKGISKASDPLPPLSNAQKTQIAGTLPTYRKAQEAFTVQGNTLDFGAGLGLGAKEMGADSFEPFAREGFTPTFSNAADIPDNAYSRITNLNVLNVAPREVRDGIVRDIGRVLKPGGEAIITTRGKDVMAAKGRPGPEPMSIITSANTYQKGFTSKELQEYVQEALGDGFEVVKKKIGSAPASITVRKK